MDVKYSSDGIACIKCSQEAYGNMWSIFDRGTWYCAEHIEELFGESMRKHGLTPRKTDD